MSGHATKRGYLYFETVICDDLFSIDEFQVMPYGGYEAFSNVVSEEGDVKTSKFQRACGTT